MGEEKSVWKNDLALIVGCNLGKTVFTECCTQMLLRRSVALLQCDEDMQGWGERVKNLRCATDKRVTIRLAITNLSYLIFFCESFQIVALCRKRGFLSLLDN